MKVISIPDFVGDNAVHSVASLMTAQGIAVPDRAIMVIFREITGGAATSRFGDATVDRTRGLPFSVNEQIFLPAVGGPARYLNEVFWDLTKIYIYAATGDTLTVAIGIW